ncbi:unnamed protein product, partial [Ectocarpus fasciculatus]
VEEGHRENRDAPSACGGGGVELSTNQCWLRERRESVRCLVLHHLRWWLLPLRWSWFGLVRRPRHARRRVSSTRDKEGQQQQE